MYAGTERTNVVRIPTADNPVEVIEGDCLDVLRGLPAECVDAVITDPPYGMAWDTVTTRFSGGHNPARRNGGRNDDRPVLNDDRLFDPSPWLAFPRVVLFGSNHFGQRLPVGTTLVWLKRQPHAFGAFLSDAEVAWMKGGHGVYCHLDQSMNAETWDRQHPTQKPIGLMRWCIRKAKVPPGGLILDPYGGSGTTAVAAVLEGCRAILIEKDPTYAAIARRRVAEALADGPGHLTTGLQPAAVADIFAGVPA